MQYQSDKPDESLISQPDSYQWKLIKYEILKKNIPVHWGSVVYGRSVVNVLAASVGMDNLWKMIWICEFACFRVD